MSFDGLRVNHAGLDTAAQDLHATVKEIDAARVIVNAGLLGILTLPRGNVPTGAREGDHILLAPPYNVTDEELETIVDLLGQTVDAVLPS